MATVLLNPNAKGSLTQLVPIPGIPNWGLVDEGPPGDEATTCVQSIITTAQAIDQQDRYGVESFATKTGLSDAVIYLVTAIHKVWNSPTGSIPPDNGVIGGTWLPGELINMGPPRRPGGTWTEYQEAFSFTDGGSGVWTFALMASLQAVIRHSVAFPLSDVTIRSTYIQLKITYSDTIRTGSAATYQMGAPAGSYQGDGGGGGWNDPLDAPWGI
jgi:hypothetical protein